MSKPRSKLTWTEGREGELRGLCSSEAAILEQLSAAVRAFDLTNFVENQSFASWFRREFKAALPENWLQDFLLLPLNRRRASVINFVVDAATDLQANDCGHQHRVLVELSFDNRQIIGTNVLKMVVGAQTFQKFDSNRSLGVLIVPSKEAKTAYGLDGAVGTSDEYLLAIDGGYSAVIGSPLFVGVVRPD